MRKKYILIILLLAVIIVAGFALWPKVSNAPVSSDTPIACTMEAKMCPDGSFVGRTGPRCEFAKCPDAISDTTSKNDSATVKGSVTLSPTCPVERVPPDPACAPKPYETSIRVFTADGTELIKTAKSKSDGSFSLELPFGDYHIEAGGEELYPRCESLLLSLKTTSPSPLSISCDTGIR